MRTPALASIILLTIVLASQPPFERRAFGQARADGAAGGQSGTAANPPANPGGTQTTGASGAQKAAGGADTQTATAAAQQKPIQVPDTVVVVEHPSNKGTGRLMIRNTTGKDEPMELSIGPFTSRVAANTSAPVKATGTIALTDAAGKPLAGAPAPLPAQKTAYAAVELSDVEESGVSTAKLFNHGQEIGTIKAVKYRLPLGIKLDVPTPDKPEISFERGKPTQINLKNDDPVTYVVDWELVVGNDVKKSDGKGQLLAPNSPLRIEIAPDDAWFHSSISQFFKADVQPARLKLLVSPEDPNFKWPAKDLPFQANLFYYPQSIRDFDSVLILLVVLLAGGVLSIALNNAIPNAFLLIDLKNTLAAAGRRTRDLSDRIDAKKRATLSTEAGRLRELIGSRIAFSPDFQTVAGEARTYAALLDARIELLSRLDALFQRTQSMAAERPLPPPTRIDEAERALRIVADHIAFSMPTEAELKDLKSSAFLTGLGAELDAASTRINTLREKDDAFASALADRIAALKARFGNPTQDDETLARIRKRLADLFDALAKAPAAVAPNEYTAYDTMAMKLEWIRDYLAAKATTAFTGEKLVNLENDFLNRLGPEGWEELRRAQRLLLQFQQGLIASDIAEAIQKGEGGLGIEGPATVRADLPGTFRVRFFGRNDLTLSSAAEEIKCFWDFGDGNKGQGWEVDHFYRRAPWSQPLSRALLGHKVAATVTFVDAAGKQIMLPEDPDKPRSFTRRITVKPDDTWLSTRTRLELVWLAASLAVPFLSLLAGARQEFLKTDAVSGLITVFLLGFSANHVKDLFKQKAA